jgi:hypothetical protein
MQRDLKERERLLKRSVRMSIDTEIAKIVRGGESSVDRCLKRSCWEIVGT